MFAQNLSGNVVNRNLSQNLKIETTTDKLIWRKNEVRGMAEGGNLQVSDNVTDNSVQKPLGKKMYFSMFFGAGILDVPKQYKDCTIGQLGLKWEHPLPQIFKNIIGDNSFTNNLFWDISLSLIWKNLNVKSEYSKSNNKSNDNPTSIGICLPINIGYRYNINNKFDIYAKGGVSWDWGTDMKVTGEEWESKNNIYLKGSDVNVNVAFGADYAKHLEISVGGGFGLNDIGESSVFGEKVKSKRIVFTVGYVF